MIEMVKHKHTAIDKLIQEIVSIRPSESCETHEPEVRGIITEP